MAKKSNIPQNPLHPFVTIEEMAAFNPADEATFTRSEVVNAVCRAFAQFGFIIGKDMAHHLGVNLLSLSGALEIAVGLNYTEMRAALILQRLKKLKEEQPELCGIGLARAVGFKSRSSLWKFLRSEVMKTLPKAEKADAYTPSKRIDYKAAIEKNRHRYGSKSRYEKYQEERARYKTEMQEFMEQITHKK